MATARDVADRLERAIQLAAGQRAGAGGVPVREPGDGVAAGAQRGGAGADVVAGCRRGVCCCGRRTCRRAGRGGRSSSRSCCCACLVLRSPSHADAHRGLGGPEDAEVQLLFFPTGGGKTEAYLGLAAYTFAIRRLQGVLDPGTPEAMDGTQGVAVLMRYTLRLLTAQQFQRAAALLCACEMLRRERVEAGYSQWGTTPFRIGLWVGSSVSPNIVRGGRAADHRVAGRRALRRRRLCSFRCARGAGRGCRPDGTWRPTGCGGACWCTAPIPRETARSHGGTPPMRACRCSPWTRRSTG